MSGKGTEDTKDVTKNNVSNDDDSGSDDKGVDQTGNEYDIEKVKVEDLPPETQKIVKGFQASYTKSKQALKEKEEQVTKDKEEAEVWKKWSSDNKPKIEEFNEWAKKQAEKGSTSDGDDDDGGDDEDDDVVVDPKKYRKIAQEESKKVGEGLDEKYGQTANMLVQLMKLQQQHTDFTIDPDKVLAYARENNTPDIEKAFQGAYQDDIVQKRIDDAVAEKEKELVAKYDTKVHDLSIPGRTPRKVIARDRN